MEIWKIYFNFMRNFPFMKKTYYLYRHIDNINNIPFYIGIGTNNKYSYYLRSKDTRKRSIEWKNYVKSINYQYSVEILFETNDYLLINKKEREFIKLYGRKDIKTGLLVNKEAGGKGKKELSKDSLNAMISKQNLKAVVVYDSSGKKVGIFNRSQAASDFTGVPYLSIKQCLMKKHNQSKGFRFLYKHEEVDKLEPINYKEFNRGVPLLCENLKTGEVKTFTNMSEASNLLNIPLGTIGNNLNGTTKTVKKTYKFNYLKQKQLL